MEEEKDEKKFDLFSKETPKQEKKQFFQKKLTKGIVAGINKEKGYVLVDVGGNGERTPYIKERHSELVIGSPIEF